MEVCVYCKSSEVYTDQWVNLNDDSVIEGAGETYCTECCESTKTMEVNNG